MEKFSDETIALATNHCVHSLEAFLMSRGYQIGEGAQAEKVVQALFEKVMDYAKDELAAGRPLY